MSLATPGVSTCATASKAEVIFVVDGSGSVGQRDFTKMLKWMGGIAKRLDIDPNGVRVGVLQYSGYGRPRANTGTQTIHWKLDAGADSNTIESKILGIRYRGGGTQTGQAIDYAMKNMWTNARAGVPRIMIVVTDGESYDIAAETPLKASNRAKAWRGAAGEKLTIYAIGVGRARQSQLNEISSDPDTKYTQNVKNFAVIETIANSLVSMICETSGGLTGVAATTIDATKVGTYTMSYVATNSHGLTSPPVTRTINLIDTTGPSWAMPSGATFTMSSGIEVEAATDASALLTANTPVATDQCAGGVVVVQFTVSVGSALNADDADKLLCGLSAAEGGSKASAAAKAATDAQDMNKLVKACSRYVVKWDAVDDAGIHSYYSQKVHVRDTVAPTTTATSSTCRPASTLSTSGGTANGSPCMFPFTYNGKQYSECTDLGHSAKWCYTNTHHAWGNCQCA
jgi:hypothetical protein